MLSFHQNLTGEGNMPLIGTYHNFSQKDQCCTKMMTKSNDRIYYVLRCKKTRHQSLKLKVNVVMLLE